MSACLLAPPLAAAQWPAGQGRLALSSFVAGTSKAVEVQLKVAMRLLRISPPVPEPPPELGALCRSVGLSGCERHTVRTADGFLLTALRIPAAARAVPVLVMHGNLASSDAWLLRRDNANLGAVLHEAGYDVWLGNFRGNTHSRQHVTLNTSDPRFWDWSFHEIGFYDIPAFVDHILVSTGQPSTHLLGHSMATICSLVALSSRPDYNKKVRFVGLMAPAWRPRGAVQLFLNLFYPFRDVARAFVRLANMWEVTPRSPLVHYISDILCMDSSPFVGICYAALGVVFGPSRPDQRPPLNVNQYAHKSLEVGPYQSVSPRVLKCKGIAALYASELQNCVIGDPHLDLSIAVEDVYKPGGLEDKDYLATIAAYQPAGTSFKTIEHFATVNAEGRFRPLGNGSHNLKSPPDYDIAAITAPVGLYYSSSDRTMDVQDMEPLSRLLPRLEDSYLVPRGDFDHLDFMWAKDARAVLYDRLVHTMRNVDSRLDDTPVPSQLLFHA